jgi:hypothetical protein
VSEEAGELHPFTADERRFELMFKYAHSTEEKVTIDLPEAWIIEALPADTTFANQVGE